MAALNGIFDVYADERAIFNRDVFVKGGFLQALVGSVSKVRSMVSRIYRSSLLHALNGFRAPCPGQEHR